MFPRFPKYCWLNYSKFWPIILAALLASAMVSVSGVQASAEAPGAFALAVSGARPIGLSEAYVAIANDTNAIWWNPAGISQIEKTSFTSTHASLYEVDGLSMNSLGFAKPTDVGVFGAGITYLRASDIPITDANGNIVEYSTQSEEILTFSYGNSLLESLHLGGSIRYLHSGQIIDYSGLSLDIGLLANPVKQFYIGAMMQQIASYLTVGDDGDSQELPRIVKAAAAYRTEKLVLGLGLDNLSSSHYRAISAGCEILPIASIILRANLRTRMQNRTNFSWGVGCGFKFRNVCLDYTYTGQPSLASSHLISIGLLIGGRRCFYR